MAAYPSFDLDKRTGGNSLSIAAALILLAVFRLGITNNSEAHVGTVVLDGFLVVFSLLHDSARFSDWSDTNRTLLFNDAGEDFLLINAEDLTGDFFLVDLDGEAPSFKRTCSRREKSTLSISL